MNRKKNLPGTQMTSDIVWAHLLHVVAVDVVAGGIRGGVEMGADRVVAVEGQH
jgi:hypothetical protein